MASRHDVESPALLDIGVVICVYIFEVPLCTVTYSLRL